MTITDITASIRRKVGEDCGLNATIKLTVDEVEHIHVDATQKPNVVSNDDLPADCIIRVRRENLLKIIEGSLNPAFAFMMGKIRVEGNMGLALHITKFL